LKGRERDGWLELVEGRAEGRVEGMCGRKGEIKGGRKVGGEDVRKGEIKGERKGSRSWWKEW